MRLIDNLREDIEIMKANQLKLNQAIAKVIAFVKRIELHITEEGDEVTKKESSKPVPAITVIPKSSSQKLKKPPSFVN